MMMTKEHLNQFKETVKNHILEYIIAGLSQSSKGQPKPRNLYEKNLGFGEPDDNLVMEAEAKNEDKKAQGNPGKQSEKVFSFKKQAATTQISIKDPNAEA